MLMYSRVGLEVKIYDTPAWGIRASQGTFSSCVMTSCSEKKENIPVTFT